MGKKESLVLRKFGPENNKKKKYVLSNSTVDSNFASQTKKTSDQKCRNAHVYRASGKRKND